MFWNNKRYHSLNYYLKSVFGEKIYKVSLDGGMTCPNRDGTLGTRGCIFCSNGGSGEFAEPLCENITLQLNHAIEKVKISKPDISRYIAYFQSFTNTYADIQHLRSLYLEAINHPLVSCLSIATRPDCLSDEILYLLEEINKIKPVWIELGLQTIHEDTAEFIRRGYKLSVFADAVNKLNNINIDTIVHVIIGLPGEDETMMLETIDYLAALPIQGIKLQLLHVLKGTDLAEHIGNFHILTMDEYISIIVKCLEHLPENIVIHRLTGDGPKNLLIEPLWSTKKINVLNAIDKTLKSLDTWQGKCSPIKKGAKYDINTTDII